jgi:hypothetical protein
MSRTPFTHREKLLRDIARELTLRDSISNMPTLRLVFMRGFVKNNDEYREPLRSMAFTIGFSLILDGVEESLIDLVEPLTEAEYVYIVQQ